MIFINLLIPVLFAASSGPSVAPKPIQSLVSHYVQAFENGDLKNLKRVTTLRFIEEAGGENNLREALRSKAPPRALKKVRWIEGAKHIYVGFELAGEVGETWMSVKKDSKGNYLIDEILHDFDPTEGQ